MRTLVRPATRRDRSQAVGVLARALHDDLAWVHVTADPVRRSRVLRAVLTAAVIDAGPHADVAERDGTVVGVAVPADAVTYLQVLGVDPVAQRSGVGRALVAEGLRRADHDGTPAYLETSAPANVAYYSSYGFAVVGEPVPLVPGGPVMWRMRRPDSRLA